MNFIVFTITFVPMVLYQLLNPINKVLDEKALPIEGWHLLPITSTWTFWINYIHEATLMILHAIVDISYVTLQSGLMLQICSQARIQKCRFKKLLQQNNNEMHYKQLVIFIKQHIYMSRYTYQLEIRNKIFHLNINNFFKIILLR